MTKLNIDFETRSTVDLRATGVYPYGQHETTDVWCMAYTFDDEPVGLLAFAGAEGDPEHWREHPGALERIYDHVRSGGAVWAWNAQFERIIWNWVLAERYGWPQLPRAQVYDTAAEAAALALPRSLDGAARALGLDVEKDAKGRQLMMKMARPRATSVYVARYQCDHPPVVGATKTETSRKTCPECRAPLANRTKHHELVWYDSREDREGLYSYCRQDVVVEREIGKLTRPLSDFERRVYLLDQKINDRGILIDVPLVLAGKDMAKVTMDEAAEVLSEVTDGAVNAVTKTGDMKDWLAKRGVPMPSLRKDAVRDMLDVDLPDDVREVLQIRQDVGKTSTKKLDAMLRALCKDNRVRGLLLYHGAGTGRWAGKLIQPQNFPRPEIDVEPLISAVLERDYGAIEEPILKVLSSMLRSMLRASPGRRFVAGDYSQIEARVLAWIAGQEDLVRLFRNKGKVYEEMAAFIFNMPVEEISKDSFERQIGKNSVLGAGFQMGADRFAEQVWEQTGIILDRGEKGEKNYCSRCDVFQLNETDFECYLCNGPTRVIEVVIRPDLAAQAITGYRTLYAKIPQFWKDINAAAIQATLNPGSVHCCGREGKIRYTMRGNVLWCILPSNRKLAYFMPEVTLRALPEPYQDIVRPSLSFVGVDSFTNKWKRNHTYGGHLTENVVQAMARDVMADAMLRLEDAGYPVVLTVHDEVLTEPRIGHGSVKEFEQIMITLPSWANGLPVAAEGWEGERYRK